MRRFCLLHLVLPALIAAAGLAPATAKPIAVERRLAHPNGVSLLVRTIDLRADSIVLSAVIANPGDREISLNRARSFVLDEGEHGIHHLNPPADNQELLVPAHAALAGDLVFIGPLAPQARELTLSSNEGIGSRDNPYDNAPVLTGAVPVEQPRAEGREYQANHPNGTALRVRQMRVGPSGCAVSLLAANGSDRGIRLNQEGSLLLTDDHGSSASVEPPTDNPELAVPPGTRLEAELAFRCAMIDDTGALTLSANRGTGGTADNPYDTLPVFVLRLPVEPAGNDAALPKSHTSIAPIARSRLSPTAAVPAAGAAPPLPQPKVTPAAPPPAADKPLGPVLQEVRSPTTAAEQPAAKPAPPNPANRIAELEAALQATRTDRGVRIILPADDLFGSARDTLDPSADQLLAKLDELIVATHPREVDIAGHTDSSGDDDDNLKLSEERAHAVAVWLEQHSPKRHPRIVEKGYGRTRPMAPNHNADGSDSPDGRARNRRVEVLLRR